MQHAGPNLRDEVAFRPIGVSPAGNGPDTTNERHIMFDARGGRDPRGPCGRYDLESRSHVNHSIEDIASDRRTVAQPGANVKQCAVPGP